MFGPTLFLNSGAVKEKIEEWYCLLKFVLLEVVPKLLEILGKQ